MAKIIDDISRTFSEYLIVPGLSKSCHTPENVSLKTPIKKFHQSEDPVFNLNIPIVSAAMQSVSGPDLAIGLARMGGLSFIYCSQAIDSQAAMVRKVKSHKAGFVQSDSNLRPTDSLKTAVALSKRTGHSIMPVTDNGEPNGRLLGILTDKDFSEFEDNLHAQVEQFMTPFEKVIYGNEGLSLREANTLLHQKKKECLPILDKHGNLVHLVFKKDYVDHRNNPNELSDFNKRLVVGAAINTHDYRERVPVLVDAGADVLCFDSSDGFTEYQKKAALWVKENFKDDIILGGGNVVSGDAFDYLVREAHLDFIKVGIGGGSICITREQKGIGRGQASAVMDIVTARDEYLKKEGVYVPICSDGGLANDTQIILALAMGADFVMMGRYFAMTFESPTSRIAIKDKLYKPYWGEGSNRAKNWIRYSESSLEDDLKFEEGVEAYVPIVGSVKEILPLTLSKIKATMSNSGSLNLREFSNNAVLTLVSQQSFIEGGTTNVETFDHFNFNPNV